MAERNQSTTQLAPASPVPDGGVRLPVDYWLPAVGSVVAGKYRIEGLLGRGGMGVVALGRQLELDRPVAIKFLRAPLALDARPLQRFVREARIIARMRSEHVVRVFDVGREMQVPFIVMERLRGHDLSKEIEGEPLSVERTVEFVLHACEALGEAHSLGIVHRDVKPSNLFVAEGFGGRESLKVLDFGVSKWLAPPRDLGTASISTEEGAVGTPAFASPEQLAHPEDIDGHTDVWALGVVLYQALSCALPFQAETIPALYSLIIGGAPAPFPNERGVPAELVAVIERCLRRDPRERYASMLELARALAPFAAARALGIIDSLATLATAERAPEISEEPEELDSPLSTTLEFSQSTPRAVEPPGVSSPKRPKGTLTRVLLLAAVGLGGLAVWGTRASAPTGAPATANDAAPGPTNEVDRALLPVESNSVAALPVAPTASVSSAPAASSSAPGASSAVVGVANSKAAPREHTASAGVTKLKPVGPGSKRDAANERAAVAPSASASGASTASARASAASAASAAPPSASSVSVPSAPQQPSASPAHEDIPLYRR
jgi:serine/threonine-protein kinase